MRNAIPTIIARVVPRHVVTSNKHPLGRKLHLSDGGGPQLQFHGYTTATRGPVHLLLAVGRYPLYSYGRGLPLP
ncbi:hypothetical protein B296_00027567 [Ensete ventricosum]|uniref:Uncharacterized protein n=1 Tax=Ensete ventricosum TaxID=4639 RepID=A0A426YC65_ENSVE|nr:hypothetical protein B296_00027567 [Ensete ventricosum]